MIWVFTDILKSELCEYASDCEEKLEQSRSIFKVAKFKEGVKLEHFASGFLVVNSDEYIEKVL